MEGEPGRRERVRERERGERKEGRGNEGGRKEGASQGECQPTNTGMKEERKTKRNTGRRVRARASVSQATHTGSPQRADPPAAPCPACGTGSFSPLLPAKKEDISFRIYLSFFFFPHIFPPLLPAYLSPSSSRISSPPFFPHIFPRARIL